MNRIFDAVYGYIELDGVEFKLVNSPIFQRLQWIKQLGPLHTIFPSAQHSRFSHSVGVFHIVSKMIEHIRKNDQTGYMEKIAEDEWTALKYAALLHDIGHVPLSHVGEKVLTESYSSRIDHKKIDALKKDKPLIDWKNEFDNKHISDSTKLHECLSSEIILKCKEIKRIFQKEAKWSEARCEKMTEKIALMIVGKSDNQVLRGLLHSELDADRLDYLLRDSFFTGMGYGHIDLDYIISRLIIVEDNNGDYQICVEDKGLHTIEHYIFGRFFLQTQAIYNRKVRLLDLLFKDVMNYMTMSKSNEVWHLMNLDELLIQIRNDSMGNLHKIYEFTDAQVFVKMRQLHDFLDEKLEKKDVLDDQESYINDCIKIIMDGQVSEPVVAHQRLIELSANNEKYDKKELENQANKIADSIAEELGVYRKRIMVNVIDQEVMKYKERENVNGEVDEEANREAVRITFRDSEGEDKIRFAAKSNATILGNLIDRALLIFNVYYIQDKHENSDQVAEKVKSIKDAFKSLVSEHFHAETQGCGCESGRHMCQIVRE